jgi:UDP-N-acetylglucosamine--N-acetylmuramyl-(pentapeptide) pyrophosphoryl-undecaprenol N-acetylglucosamine transferase
MGPVVIAAGGTGGHMFPALALARELRSRGQDVALLTDARGARYVGDDVPCHLISAGSPSGSPTAQLAGLGRLAVGLAQCLAMFVRLRPSAAACFGGYASVPPALAAAAIGRPLMLHEQNAVLGKANRLVAKFARRVALSFEHTERTARLPRERMIVTGNPVRTSFVAGTGRYDAPARGEAFRLLVLGGSQGARVLSDVVPGGIALLPDSLRRRLVITQQCRPEDIERARAAYAALGMKPALEPFFSDVPGLMSQAHLVVTRSGASTVAELLAVGRPALLVPYAHAADDHQRANAAELQHVGAAEMLLEKAFSAGALAERLRGFMEEPSRLETMAARARTVARPDAVQLLADAVLALLPREALA